MISKFLRLKLLILISIFQAGFAQDYDEYTLEDSVTVTAQKDGKVATYNTIAFKLPIPLRSTPASVSVVPQALLANQGGIVLGDALRNVSGVNCQTGNGVFDYFMIRGFNSLDNGLVMTDGTAEPEVMFYNMYNLERVEVLKGPSAFLYGGNPLSGTVNLVRKTPVFDNFLHLGGSYGQFNAFRSTLDAGIADPEKGLALRLNGLWQRSDFYRNDKENETYAVNPAFTWRINERSTMQLNYEYTNSQYKPDAGIPLQFNLETMALDLLPDVDRQTSYQTPFDESDQTMQRLKADFHTQLSSRVTLHNKAYYSDLDWISNGTLLLGAFPMPDGSYSVGRTMTFLDSREKLLGNQLEAQLSFHTGALKHTVLGGVELRRTTNEFLLELAPPPSQFLPNGLPPLDLSNPVETVNRRDDIAVFPLQTGDVTSTTVAPYLVNHMRFSRAFQLFFGGRYDNIQFEKTGSGAGTDTLADRSYTHFSPMVGAVISPAENTSLYANFGQSFAPPSAQAARVLDAEESRQIEAGIRQELLGGRLNATLAVYQLTKENIAIPDQFGIPSQVGDQESRGVEVEIVAEPLRNWLAFINYAYTDAELTNFNEFVQTGSDDFGQPQYTFFDRSGNTPAFVPEHLVNLWTTREFTNGFGLGAGLRYLSSQFIADDNVFEIDPALMLDASVFYQTAQMRWQLNFRNITDTDTETRGFGASSVIPANPFSVVGGVEINL